MKTIHSLLPWIQVAMVKQYALKQFISNYYELCNIVGYLLLLKNVKPSLNIAKESVPLHLFENDTYFTHVITCLILSNLL